MLVADTASFCIAPLDVVKIRLQLQVQSLPDPKARQSIAAPVYRGTLPTLRTIFEQEGLTVCQTSVISTRFLK